MKVLLFEQWDGGHYSNYMNCLVPRVSAICDNLIIAINERMHNSDDARRHWSNLPNVEFVLLPDVSPRLGTVDRLAAASNLISTMKKVRPSFTIVPSADAQATALAGLNIFSINLIRSFGPIEGTMHCGYGYAATDPRQHLKEAVYSRTYHHVPFACVNFVNFAYYEFVLAKRVLQPARTRLVGDPVPQPPRIGKESARRLLGLDLDGRYIGILGTLDDRKAVPKLLAAFRKAKLSSNDRLLLAGNLAPSFSTLIDNDYQDLVRSGRLVILNRFLTAAELAHGYEALDVATIIYDSFPGLASLALKAIAAGTPIIANDFGWLGAMIRRFDIGTSTDIRDSDSFATALCAALENSCRLEPSEPIRRLLAFHSEDNFASLMTKGLKQAGGLADTPTLDWSWVVQALPPQR